MTSVCNHHRLSSIVGPLAIFILIGVQTLMIPVPKINVGAVCRDALEANVGLALSYVMRKT